MILYTMSFDPKCHKYFMCCVATIMHHFYIYEVVITQKWGLEIERKTTSAVEAFHLPTKKRMRISYVCCSSGCYCWCCESLGVQMGNGNATL